MWVAIYTNGKLYSDHMHKVVAASENKEKIEEVVNNFNEWHKKYLESGIDFYDFKEVDEWLKDNPCPIETDTYTIEWNWLYEKAKAYTIEVKSI